MDDVFNFATNFGDPAVLLPLAFVILVWLLAMRCPRGAVAWLAATAFCGAATGLLKIYFFACPLVADLVSPSGHTSLSTLVYGAVGVIVAARLQRVRRLVALGFGVVAIATIAVSRLLLNVHTALEISAGLLIGAISLSIFAGYYLRHPPACVSVPPLAVAGILLMVLLHGRELRAEGLLHAISVYLRIGPMACGSE